MARFDILGLQYFTDGGELLGGGKLNFYETGTTTRKDTFSDAAMTIANTNPVTLDADGRAPNIFFAGLAKCVLTDSAGAILETRDPVGDDSATGNAFAKWVADRNYSFNEPVTGSNGYIYTSLINNNLGNDPLSNPLKWQLIAETIGIPDSPNGNVLIIDTSLPQKVGSATRASINTLVPISTTTASNVATVDFTGITSTYNEYQIRVVNARPQTDNQILQMRTSADGGSTYDSGVNDYRYLINSQTDAAAINLTIAGVGNAGVNEAGWSGTVAIYNPSGAVLWKEMMFDYVMTNAAANAEVGKGYARRSAPAVVNAVRFFFASGNIASGTFTLYGVRTS